MLQGIVRRGDPTAPQYVGSNLELSKQISDDLVNRYMDVNLKFASAKDVIAKDNYNNPALKQALADSFQAKMQPFVDSGKLYSAQTAVNEAGLEFARNPARLRALDIQNNKQLTNTSFSDAKGYSQFSAINQINGYSKINKDQDVKIIDPITGVEMPITKDNVNDKRYTATGQFVPYKAEDNPLLKMENVLKLFDDAKFNETSTSYFDVNTRDNNKYLTVVDGKHTFKSANDVISFFGSYLNTPTFKKHNEQLEFEALGVDVNSKGYIDRLGELYQSVSNYEKKYVPVKGRTEVVAKSFDELAYEYTTSSNAPKWDMLSKETKDSYVASLNESQKRELYLNMSKAADKANVYTMAADKFAFDKNELNLNVKADEYSLKKMELDKNENAHVTKTETGVVSTLTDRITKNMSIYDAYDKQSSAFNDKTDPKTRAKIYDLKNKALDNMLNDLDDAIQDDPSNLAKVFNKTTLSYLKIAPKDQEAILNGTATANQYEGLKTAIKSFTPIKSQYVGTSTAGTSINSLPVNISDLLKPIVKNIANEIGSVEVAANTTTYDLAEYEREFTDMANRGGANIKVTGYHSEIDPGNNAGLSEFANDMIKGKDLYYTYDDNGVSKKVVIDDSNPVQVAWRYRAGTSSEGKSGALAQMQVNIGTSEKPDYKEVYKLRKTEVGDIPERVQTHVYNEDQHATQRAAVNSYMATKNNARANQEDIKLAKEYLIDNLGRDASWLARKATRSGNKDMSFKINMLDANNNEQSLDANYVITERNADKSPKAGVLTVYDANGNSNKKEIRSFYELKIELAKVRLEALKLKL